MYSHCPYCGYYQDFEEGEPTTLSDGDSLTVIGPGECWLCGELYYKVFKSVSRWEREVKRIITVKGESVKIEYV